LNRTKRTKRGKTWETFGINVTRSPKNPLEKILRHQSINRKNVLTGNLNEKGIMDKHKIQCQ
jgi:hypothetical protein